PDLELARQDDDELPSRRRMPVDEVADRALPERDLGGREPLGPGRRAREIDRFDVGLAVGAGVKPECLHGGLSLVTRWLMSARIIPSGAGSAAPVGFHTLRA